MLRFKRFLPLTVLVMLMAVGPLAGQAVGSHYRGGDISYQQSGAPTNVNFQSTTSFRMSAFFSSCPAPGTPVNIFESIINFGDGTQSDAGYVVVACNQADDWFTARKDVSHNYPNTNRRNAFYTSCCTISTLNNNNDASFQQFVDVNLTQDPNSPKTSVPPIVNVGTSGVQSFFVPAADPGGQTLFWRLASGTESGAGAGAQVNPPGLAINSSTGQVTWDTTSRNPGLWHATIVIEARNGAGAVVSATHTTFLINVGQGVNNQPPAYDTPPTPANGTEFTVAPGANLSFNLQATDPNAGDVVTIVPGPLPPGATFNGTPGNPATGSFSFTPTAAQDGQDFVVNFTAQDDAGGSTFVSYTIRVRSSTGDDDEDGRMTGKGTMNSMHFAFVLDCDSNPKPAFQGKRGSTALKVTAVTDNDCTDEPGVTPQEANAQFDTMKGTGTGTWSRTAVNVAWTFVDGGPEGSGDSSEITVTRQSDGTVLFTGSGSPPGKYPGSFQSTGFNTALAPAAAPAARSAR